MVAAVLVVVGILGLTGWRVYDARHSSSLATAVNSVANPSAAPLAPGNSNQALKSNLTNINQGLNQNNQDLSNSNSAVNYQQLNVSD
jgi:predicted negative regulator of RcsB-dependent stress response